MELLASTPVKDLTLALALLDGPVPIAKSESPMSALTISVSMVVLAKVLVSTITLVCVLLAFTESIANCKPKLVPTTLARMMPIAKTPLKDTNAVVNQDSQESTAMSKLTLAEWRLLAKMEAHASWILKMRDNTNAFAPQDSLDLIANLTSMTAPSTLAKTVALALISFLITSATVFLDSLAPIAKKTSTIAPPIHVPMVVLVMTLSMTSFVLVLQDTPAKIAPLKSTNVPRILA